MASFASFSPSHKTPVEVAHGILWSVIVDTHQAQHKCTCGHTASARGDDLALARQDLLCVFSSYCFYELLSNFCRGKESGVGLLGVGDFVRTEEGVEGQGE